MPNNKVIVKVGKQSTLQLRDAKVYRAITVAEMESLSKKLDGANIIIIEHIYSSEYSAVCTFLKEYLATEGNRVFFFTPDNDDVTTGVADELDLDIYLTSTDLYHAVQVNCGINFDPDITKPHIDQSLFGDEADIFDNESFQNMLDVASANTEGILADKDLPTIKSKDQLDSDDFTDEELESLQSQRKLPLKSRAKKLIQVLTVKRLRKLLLKQRKNQLIHKKLTLRLKLLVLKSLMNYRV